MLALDVSKWSKPDGSAITVEEWQQQKRYGVGLAVVGLFHGREGSPVAEETLGNAREAGLLTAGYFVISPGQTGDFYGLQAKGWARAEWDKLLFVAVDLELGGITVEQVEQALDFVRLEGKQPIIYTAAWWWVPWAVGLEQFAEVPAWLAKYDWDDVAMPDPLRGLGPVVAKQWTGTTPASGGHFYADYNTFDDTWIDSLEKEDDMTPIPVSLDAIYQVGLNLIDRGTAAEDETLIAHGQKLLNAVFAIKQVTYRDPTQP